MNKRIFFYSSSLIYSILPHHTFACISILNPALLTSIMTVSLTAASSRIGALLQRMSTCYCPQLKKQCETICINRSFAHDITTFLHLSDALKIPICVIYGFFNQLSWETTRSSNRVTKLAVSKSEKCKKLKEKSWIMRDLPSYATTVSCNDRKHV